MQIVRDLGGYTLGRSDLVRRAMSKKKQSVMEKERKNFVYGNEEEGVPGCVSKGISESVANHIYDEMMDFAKYAFNKSHAAAYALVAYQTAWLKHYYPVEFMAALMTSVIDNFNKVSLYIYTCKSMGIRILPPDINEGVAGFSVSGNDIRYGLASIKGVGWPVIEGIVSERNANGPFRSLQDFIDRLSGDINKRIIENFIKAGAMDTLPGTRKQKMAVYSQIMDSVTSEKKSGYAGQMSLFDIIPDEDKEDYELRMPEIGEYEKDELLAFEREILGLYVSGHPLDEYEGMWRKNVTNTTLDFAYDEESKSVKVTDNMKVTVGGVIETVTIKYTKTGKKMAFLSLEDLLGTVEVIVWPTDYERNGNDLEENCKVFIKGRVSVEEEKDAKVICEQVIPFERMPRKLWIRIKTKEEFAKRQDDLYKTIEGSDGHDTVVIYIEETKQKKELTGRYSVHANEDLTGKLEGIFGEGNVKVV